MAVIRDVIGLAIVAMALINPFGIDIMLRILLFILGFEIMSIVVKGGMLVLSIVFPISTILPFVLLGLLALDLILRFVITGVLFHVIFRPVILFIAALMISNAPLPSAIIGIANFVLIVLGMRFKF